MQFSSPLLVQLLLFINKETTENIQHDSKAMNQAERIEPLLPGITRELEIFMRCPLNAALVSELTRAMCEGICVSVTGEPAARVVHLRKDGNMLMRKLVGSLAPYEIS